MVAGPGAFPKLVDAVEHVTFSRPARPRDRAGGDLRHRALRDPPRRRGPCRHRDHAGRRPRPRHRRRPPRAACGSPTDAKVMSARAARRRRRWSSRCERGPPAPRRAIAEIRLDNPAKLNALTAGMLAELAAHCATIERTREVRAVVLAAEGARAFCAGADIVAWAALSPSDFARLWVARRAPRLRPAGASARPDRGGDHRPRLRRRARARRGLRPAGHRAGRDAGAARDRRRHRARLVGHPAAGPPAARGRAQGDGAVRPPAARRTRARPRLRRRDRRGPARGGPSPRRAGRRDLAARDRGGEMR